jgi:uncharacterized membrane protein
MDVIVLFLKGIQIILGFFLLLFVPGFAISLIYFPRLTDIQLIERLIYSLVLSIGSVIVLVLFMDVVLGIYTTPRNISIIICVFSVFALMIWQCEKKFGHSTLKLKLESLTIMDFQTIQSYGKKLKNFISNHIGVK